jgi:ComF family protein
MATPFLKHTPKLLQQSLDLLFPPHCAGCKRGGHVLCPLCLQTMQPLTGALCGLCGMPLLAVGVACVSCQQKRLGLDGLRHVNWHQGALREAIRALKYWGWQRLAEPLGRLLAEAFICYGLRTDGIVPMPLHGQREQERGYNQAVLLARVCAAYLKVPCLENLVIRQRATRAQVGLSAQERRQNVAGAFALVPGLPTSALTGRNLLLIDDVSTSGATLEACATPLYAARTHKVWGLVLARPIF